MVLLLTIDSCSKGREEGCRHRKKQPGSKGTVGRNIEVNDDELGFVASDELNPQKSRILLMLKPRTTAEIQALFQSY
jgi:L-asparaginase